MNLSPLESRALRQLSDYDARQPGTLFADGLTLNEAEAYELQSAVSQLRSERGEQVIGYKVGCTSPTIRQQLGIDHSITGRLFSSEHHASDVLLERSSFAELAIEGELAVELNREPQPEDFVTESVPACVERVFPVIELHNYVMRGEHPSAGELIANNAIHAGFVAADGIVMNATNRQFDHECWLKILANDVLVEECIGEGLIQTIRTSLQWLSEVVAQRGDRLSAGQIVLTGSIPSLIPVEQPTTIRVETKRFGNVNATFV